MCPPRKSERGWRSFRMTTDAVRYWAVSIIAFVVGGFFALFQSCKRVDQLPVERSLFQTHAQIAQKFSDRFRALIHGFSHSKTLANFRAMAIGRRSGSCGKRLDRFPQNPMLAIAAQRLIDGYDQPFVFHRC